MAETCPLCGAPVPPGAATCANCGAQLKTQNGKPLEALIQGLDDLTGHADAALAEELETLKRAAEQEAEAVDRTLGELDAAEVSVAITQDRLRHEEGDLADFVRKVESAIASRSRVSPAPPPRPSRLAGPLLAFAVVVCAAGLFLLPLSLSASALLVLTGIALLAIGAGLYWARSVPQ